MSKLLLVLCLLVATAYTAEVSVLSSIQEKIEAVKEAIVQTIHKAIQSVQESIEKAKETASDSLEKVKEKGQEVASKFYKAFDNFLEKVDEKIAEITASADGVDVTECTRLASEIRETALDATANSSICVVKKIHEGYRYVESINRIANEMSQDLALTEKEAEECTEGLDGIKASSKALYCVNAALLRAGHVATEKVPSVVKEVVKLSWTVGTIVPSLSTCATVTTFETLYEKFEGVYKQIEHCVQEKIHEAHGTTPAL